MNIRTVWHVFIIIVTIIHICIQQSNDRRLYRCINKDTLSKETGYTIETHEIETEDHYLLTYHRVPRGRNGDDGVIRKPLILVGGIFMCSYIYLDQDIPYVLAEQGYDVWLRNYRGNYYSRKHKSLNPDTDKQFWNFTLTEFGQYDLTAGIDFILDKTGQAQVVYVGGSMGTTMFWMLGATRPEYMSKVSFMIAITPVVRTNLKAHLPLPRYLIITSFVRLLKRLGVNEIKMFNDKYRKQIVESCINNRLLDFRCRLTLQMMHVTMTGLKKEQLVVLQQAPSSSVSRNVLEHYLQMGTTQRFQKFDYGKRVNKKIYKTRIPPELTVKKITCPVYLMYSKMDDIAAEEDVRWLSEQLPNKPIRLFENLNDFTHMDFFLHKDIESRLNKPLFEFLKNKL